MSDCNPARWIRMCALLASMLLLVMPLGCASPLGIAALGVGSSTAVAHTLSGVTYRTFTAPLPRVNTASAGALGKMGIKLASSEKLAGIQILKATASDREIEIELEPITAATTRMRVTARKGGVFYDSATATEIIQQTARLLGTT